MTEIIGKHNGKQPIGMEAKCFSCDKLWNVSTLPATAKNVKCTCGGFVVTPTGQIMSRPIYDEFDSIAPLIELEEHNEIVTKSGIILPGSPTPKKLS